MSRRRYISTEISRDGAVNKLARECGDFAVLLYTWMIPHVEDDACLKGTPEEILFQVIPGRRDKTPQDVEIALEGMRRVGLIEWDRENDIVGLPHASFYKYQSYINTAKRRTSPVTEQGQVPPTNAEERRISAENATSPSPSPSPSLSLPEEDNPPSPLTGEETVSAPVDTVDNSKPTATKPASDDYTADFLEFWAFYPKRTAKKAAYGKWRALLRKGADPGELLTAAKHYAIACQGREERYILQPETFLGPNERWKDYLAPPSQSAQPAVRARSPTPRSNVFLQREEGDAS